MHSVVVVGDVLWHEMRFDPMGPCPAEPVQIPGGAWMVEDVINRVFEVLEKNRPSEYPNELRPIVYGMAREKCPRRIRVRETWKIDANLEHQGLATEGYRCKFSSLPNENQSTYFDYPELSQLLRNKIDVGQFETPASDDWSPFYAWQLQQLNSTDSLRQTKELLRSLTQMPSCPDVAVFLDLGYGALHGSSKLDLSGLYNRMLDACKRAETIGLPLLEPAIVYVISYSMSSHKTLIDMLKDGGSLLHRLMDSPLSSHAVVVLDANDLRQCGVGISADLSWERTVEDTIYEIQSHEHLRQLLKFSNVLIRYSHLGVLHISNVSEAHGLKKGLPESTPQQSCRLFFIPYEVDEGPSELDEIMLGNISLFAAGLVRSLYDICRGNSDHPFLQTLGEAIASKFGVKSIIVSCNELSKQHVAIRSLSTVTANEWYQRTLDSIAYLIDTGLSSSYVAAADASDSPPVVVVAASDVPSVYIPGLSILSQRAQYHQFGMAQIVAMRGVEALLAGFETSAKKVQAGIPFPMLNVGGRYVIDRREIEGFRAIRRLMLSHREKQVKKEKTERPLSIGVFGPPGSGKSMAVKMVIEEFQGKNYEFPFKSVGTFNLSQYTNTEELQRGLRRIAKSANDQKNRVIPVAFFDEFDTSSPTPFSWLRSFLSPMEDGQVFDADMNESSSIQSAILVFAGGTSSTFSEFSMSMRSRNKSDKEYLEFVNAKGPDFCSRLQGVVDVMGINPAGPDDYVYMMRRAVIIRSILEEKGAVKVDGLSDIDEKLLRAILETPNFKHGTRSLRMLIETCLGSSKKASLSRIPPFEQLESILDAKAFLGSI